MKTLILLAALLAAIASCVSPSDYEQMSDSAWASYRDRSALELAALAQVAVVEGGASVEDFRALASALEVAGSASSGEPAIQIDDAVRVGGLTNTQARALASRLTGYLAETVVDGDSVNWTRASEMLFEAARALRAAMDEIDGGP